jgi:hypothetical protein
MEQSPTGMIKAQIEFKEALEAQKLKELELIQADLKVLRLQLKGAEGSEAQTKINIEKKKSEENLKAKEKEIYLGPRTFSETIKTSPFPISNLKVLGKLPRFTLDDFQITSRKEQDSHVQFSEENFKNHLKRLIDWNENEKVNCFYMVDRKNYGVKAVLLPGTPATLAFNLFQFGLIDNMYLSPNLDELSLFPHYLKEAVQMYKKNVSKDRGIFLKYFSAYPDFITKQTAKHLIYIGISNNSYPLKDEPTEITYDEEQITSVLINQLASIFFQCQNIGKDSHIKALYKGKNTLLLSKTAGKVIKERDMQLLSGFELPFYAFDGPEIIYRTAVLNGLCQRIKENQNHACERCTKGKQIIEAEDDKDSVEAIIED